jgi:hypothetical protein
MILWEYHIEVIKLELGAGEEWSIRDSPFGETKLKYRLNEFGNWGWELVSVLPVLSSEGNPAIPPSLYAVFKRHPVTAPSA